MLPDFLRDPYRASRVVGITGNPYYCPLPNWALPMVTLDENGTATGEAVGGYVGIECLHCPGENPKTIDGRKDFTYTCSGHGVCIDGTTCQCEPNWAGFSSDCSQLACPTETVTDADGSVRQVFCSGVSPDACINPPAITITNGSACDADGNPVATPGPYLENPIDYVNFHVECATKKMIVAQCACTGITQAPPDCAPVQLKGDSLTVIDAANPRHRNRSGGGLAGLAVAVAAVGATLLLAVGPRGGTRLP